MNHIQIVEDSTVFIKVDSSKIAVSVVTYTYMQRPSKAKLDRLTDGTNEAYRVFLVHQPAEELVRFAEGHGYGLLLAGHTHGGGMAIGIPGLLLLAPANLETKYVSGLYHSGRMAVCVTNGLGLTLTPIRFNAPAEITILNLR
jgi:predicted MPP superfamily phosphohydrolase